MIRLSLAHYLCNAMLLINITFDTSNFNSPLSHNYDIMEIFVAVCPQYIKSKINILPGYINIWLIKI